MIDKYPLNSKIIDFQKLWSVIEASKNRLSVCNVNEYCWSSCFLLYYGAPYLQDLCSGNQILGQVDSDLGPRGYHVSFTLQVLHCSGG